MSERHTINGVDFVFVHDKEKCLGEWCIFHNPMVPLEKRNLLYRSDRNMFEDTCVHGVGHPSPEQFGYWTKTNQEYQCVHGCDSCCQYKGWPLTW